MFLLEFITVFIIMALGCSYFVQFMLLQKKDSHEGPFKSRILRVYFPQQDDGDVLEPAHYQAVAFQDRIRAFFKVYRIDGSIWTVDDYQAEVWTCPKCLTFWLCLPFSFAHQLLVPGPVLLYPFIHLAMVKLSLIIDEKL